MSEQELNAATQKSPCDLLKDRKKQYDDEYRKLSRNGSFQLKLWKKTIRRCRIYKTLDLLRSLLFIAFSFEKVAPKEKALQKEKGRIRGAARSTPRQLFEKSWIKTFL